MRDYRTIVRQLSATSLALLLGLICIITPHPQAASTETNLTTMADEFLVPPANDNFAAAQVISGTGGTAAVTNVEATGETGEPNHAGSSLPLNSVWYRWTAPSNLSMTFLTFGGGLNTTIAVYTGPSVNALTLVAANDNAPNASVSSVTFAATGFTIYHIAVDGSGAATGTLTGGLRWGINRAESTQQGDYDDLGGSDFAVFRLSMGMGIWYILHTGTGAITSMHWGGGSDRLLPGSYDGTHTNICVWRESGGSGTFYKAPGLFAGARTQPWGLIGDRPVLGDFDGDDKDDFAIWRATTSAVFYVLRSSNSTLLAQPWGNGDTDFIVPGDYDGDGKTDFSVLRTGGGAQTFYVQRSSDGTLLAQTWGLATDLAVAGDYDGDGKSDFVAWRSSSNTFYVLRSSDGTNYAVTWGLPSDVPAPGDYDADGRTDITVWRPSNGTFYVLRSSTGTLLAQPWGMAGDLVVAFVNVH